MIESEIDIAVVGAGVAGAYAAWRLQEALCSTSRIALFEYGERVGGRLYSKTLPGMPHVPAELGGMRYMTSQKLVCRLVNELELGWRPFPMGNPNPPPDDPRGEPIGRKRNLVYVRGRHLRVQDLSDSKQIPYRLSWAEQGMNPTQLQVQVMNQLVPNASKLSSDQWFDVEVFGKPLYSYGFWNILARVLSSEAYAFMRDAGGYDANLANANAVYQLPATEYGSTKVEYRALREGYQSLPLKLVDRFRGRGGDFQPNQRLAALQRRPDGRYALTLIPTETHTELTVDRPGAEAMQVIADKVILAMPRRALELVDWRGWRDDPWLREHLGSVLIQGALKLLFGYEYPWWRALGLHAGRSITDLPIRQVYYFGTEGEQDRADPSNLNSLLDASYNDLHTVPFWKGLERGEPFTGHCPKHIEPNTSPVPCSRFPATQAMVEAAQQQVAELHGQRELPNPYTAVYHDWSEDPYGGGWHEWKAGYRYDRVITRMLHPIESENVYICGEAYSAQQGWVEGSLATAERMLQSYFNLARPGWLPESYEL